MKIKKKINADTEVFAEPVTELTIQDSLTAVPECCGTGAECACIKIREAIDCLAPLAKGGDSLAREAIANLSVVLLELK